MGNTFFRKIAVSFIMIWLVNLAVGQTVVSRPAVSSDYPGVFLFTDGFDGWTPVEDEAGGYISPAIDVSDARQPVVIMGCDAMLDAGVLYASRDGSDFVLVSRNKDRSVIPSWTKYLRIEHCNPYYVIVADIPDDGDDIVVDGVSCCTVAGEAPEGEYSISLAPVVTENTLPEIDEDWLMYYYNVTLEELEGNASLKSQVEEDWKDWMIGKGIWKQYQARMEFSCTASQLSSLNNGFIVIREPNVYPGWPSFSFSFLFKVGEEYIQAEAAYAKVSSFSMAFTQNSLVALIPPGTTEIRACCSWGLNEPEELSDAYNYQVYIYDLRYRQKQVLRDTSYPLDVSYWYDVNSDGVLEWMSGNNDRISFMPDYGSYAKVLKYHYGKWLNLNNDEWIDAYLGRQGYIWIGDDEFTNTVEQGYVPASGYALNPIDFNNDGRMDFIQKGISGVNMKKGKALMQGLDGRWHPTTVNIVTADEYAGVQKELELTTGGVGIPGMEDMFLRDGVISTALGTFGSYDAIDLNGDGLIDFVDADDGVWYMNAGNGILVEQSFGGKVLFRDLNGDGLMDYVIYDRENLKVTASLSQKDGTRIDVPLISGLYCSDNIWCYDFDHDGDVDILIPFDYNVEWFDNGWNRFSNGGSFLVMMENRGDGTFKKYENFVDGKVFFTDCLDIDADGNYEVIATREGDGVDCLGFRVSGLSVDTTPELLLADIGNNSCHLVDIDNSGKTLLMCGEYVYTVTERLNTAPEPPAAPQYYYDEATGMLKVSWLPGSDAESSVADLTYALRIGTAPDKCDMLFVNALPDGRRRNRLNGNCGHSLLRSLNVESWPEGKYYISVQSVDPNHRGSRFSEYAVFDKKSKPVGFVLSRGLFFSVGDTCTVVVNGAADGCTYKWNWDGADVVEQNSDGTEYTIVFNTGGEKCIKMELVGSDGQVCGTAEESITVLSSNVTSPYSDNYTLSFDMDDDGRMEASAKETKFYEGDDAGSYTPVKYIYNTNLPAKSVWYFIDANRDGRADMLGLQNKTAQLLTNDGDKQMSLGEEYELEGLERFDGNWVDIDNDGTLDVVFNYGYDAGGKSYYPFALYVNDGDSKTFKFRKTSVVDPSFARLFYDYDRDGLMDVITTDGTKAVYRNNGNYDFTKVETLKDLGYLVAVADLDADGKADYIYNNTWSGFGLTSYSDTMDILWGDGTETSIPCQSSNPFAWFEKVYDFDNDGCLDILTSCKENDPAKYCIISFRPDRSYSLTWINANSTGNTNVEYYRTDGSLALGNMKLAGRDNTAPSAPTSLRSSQSSKAVVIEWNHSVDKETPAALMRYNMSIKRKGAEGEGAYFWSPLNSTKNGVHVPSPVRLLTSNRLTIPITSITPGEYEVQVQGVDGWNMQSDFSDVYYLTVTESGVIDMPMSTAVDKCVTVKIMSNTSDEVMFGDDATSTRNTDGSYTVSWSTTGMKTVSVGTLASQSIYVHPRPEAAFVLPDKVLLEATVNVTAANVAAGQWEVSRDGGTFGFVSDNADVSMVSDGTDHVTFQFSKTGTYELRHTVADEYSEASHISSTTVTDENSRQEIDLITVDGATGLHRITWTEPAILPDGVTGVNVYRETSRLNVYELAATLPVGQEYYVDAMSKPEVQASRYRLAYALGYGESLPGTAHQTMHVMINRGVGDTWNLIWNKYEGRDIESYRILGGTTPDNLSMIAEVSGNMSSYSDLRSDEGMQYYAVETVIPVNEAKSHRYRASSMMASRSNVVSVSEATAANLATEIIIKTEGNRTDINLADNSSLQLTAWIYPLGATIQRVNWIVVEGETLATIDGGGKLTATGAGDGDVTVRAYAVDGSNVYAEIVISISGFVPDGILTIEPEGDTQLRIAPVMVEHDITVSGLGEGSRSQVYVFGAGGMVYQSVETTLNSVTINCDSLTPGMYFIKVMTGGHSQSARFVKVK